MSNNDVIVFDEEYTYAATEITSYCDVLIKRINDYSNCMNIVLERAISDEKITSKLRDLVNRVESVKAEIEMASKTASDECRSYVNKIDEADQFLY